MNDWRLAGDTESGIGIETPVCQGGFHLSLSVEACRARYADATTMPIIAALTEIRHCFPCRVGTMQQWEDDEGGWSGCSNERSGQTKMDEKEERTRECEKVGERARRSEMEKITRSRHTGRRERVQSLLFYLVPFLFRLALRLSFSLSLPLCFPPCPYPPCTPPFSPVCAERRDCRYYGRVRIVTLIN